MGLQNITIQNEYNSLEEDVVREFLIPALSESNRYDRAAGYFSSSGLAKQTVGIAELVKKGGHIRIIASPELSEEDVKAIDEGYKLKDSVIRESLLRSLRNPEDEYEAERLNLLSNLIAAGILDIKVALLRTESGIFHDKFGILYDENGDSVAFRGSMNETENAYYHNFETIDVYRSWVDDYRVESKKETFNKMWDDLDSSVTTVMFTEIKDAILSRYKRDNNLDWSIDLRQFGQSKKRDKGKEWLINIPGRVHLYEYQTDAIAEWENRDFCGIYDMATGTGKTFTALASMERFEKRHGNILGIVVCPYIHLVNQWAEDVQEWGINPIICHSESPLPDWRKSLTNAFRRYKTNSKSFICLVTNDTFGDALFTEMLNSISDSMNAVLVVDEVHNFGAQNLSKKLPENIRYRLGLSATVERYMDDEGTGAILQYFGEKCIYYPIERAIKEKALVNYEYYPIIVTLTYEELEEYRKITKQITKCIVEKNGKKKISDIGQQLLFKRTRLVAGAENKLETLKEVMLPYKDDRHLLVYCGATRGFEEYKGQKERQIDRVEKILGLEYGMSTHRFTAEEDAEQRRKIKEGFADGDYQVITAIKCLDEGVNIPNIHVAFIMASSRNPKEFIQRRGRVLRKAPGKERAIIYDFVTLPRALNEVHFGDFEADRAIVLGELARIYEFGRYSINSRVADSMIDDIQSAYDIDIFVDSLDQEMEEAYGEGRD
nr:DEAD/DEAH box helicase family protein [uncultured Butyrivibrio sp.]